MASALWSLSRHVALLLLALFSACNAANARHTVLDDRALQSDPCALVRCAAPLACAVAAGGQAQCMCAAPYVLSGTDCIDPCIATTCPLGTTCQVVNSKVQCICPPPLVLDGAACVLATNCASVRCPDKAHCAVVGGQATCVCQDPLILSNNDCLDPCAAVRCAAGYRCQVDKKAAACVYCPECA
ncbi:hypothetical protein CLOP_g23201 [Closterium sp. NIES-67]|nr:hypothetical protein CLOP_g23201 [Closterium sp. NIES-67]